jgi:hypothetical protein
MGQAAAERGETVLGEDELDAVADGYYPDPEYRPGGKPSTTQFMSDGYDDGSCLARDENSFWSYPPPPEDTQAYLDWEQMAARHDEDISYPRPGAGPWDNAYDYRDTAWDPGWPPMSSEDM